MNSIKITEECIIELEKLAKLRLSEDSRRTAVRDLGGFLELCSSLCSIEPSTLPVSAPTGELRADEAHPFKNADNGSSPFAEYSVPRGAEGDYNA